jgi:hypothetical protein
MLPGRFDARYTVAVIAVGPIAFRYLELALLGLSLLLLVLVFLRRRPPGLVWVGALATLTVAVHLFWEEGRWQFLGIYVLVLVLSFWVARPSGPGTGRKPYRAGGLVLRIVVAVLWVVSTLVPLAVPIPVMAEPSGHYPVGTVTIVAPRAGDASGRPVQVWYPATRRAEYAAPYWSAATLAENRLPGLPHLMATHLTLVPTPATLRAPMIAEGPLPLMLVTRGAGWLPGDLDQLAREAASQGWLVIDPGPIDQADAYVLLSALGDPELDGAIGGRFDPNRVTILAAGDAADLELGVSAVKIGGAHVLRATVPGGAVALDYPGLVIPDTALTQRHRLINPARLLVGGSDVSPRELEATILRVFAGWISPGAGTPAVLGGQMPDAGDLISDDDRAVIRPVSSAP